MILEDEDEFAANARTYGYPADLIAQATAAAADLRAALTGRTEPFGRRRPPVARSARRPLTLSTVGQCSGSENG